jgi:hypothetical protein
MNKTPMTIITFISVSYFGRLLIQNVVILIATFVLLATGKALPSEPLTFQGGYTLFKNAHLAPMKNGAIGASSYGDNGDRDRGEIRVEIPMRDLKNLDFFYSGYPNGSTLRYELRAPGRTPVVLNLKKAAESWLELPLPLPERWNIDDDLTIVAIDENDQFTGWIALAVAPQRGMIAKIFNEWRQVLAILWVLFIGFVICGPVFFCRDEPMARCALAMLWMGFWCMVAFYLALLLPGEWHRVVLPLAITIGLVFLVFLGFRCWRKNPLSYVNSSHGLILGIVSLGCFVLPLTSRDRA